MIIIINYVYTSVPDGFWFLFISTWLYGWIAVEKITNQDTLPGYLKKIAINYGIPAESIILTEIVENTDQEAKAIKKLFPDKNIKIILVTSARHMNRALNVFNAADLNVIAYPVDFKNNSKNFTLMDLIPSADALNSTSYFVREMIGRTYYKVKYREYYE